MLAVSNLPLHALTSFLCASERQEVCVSMSYVSIPTNRDDRIENISIEALLDLSKSGLIDPASQSGRRARKRALKQHSSKAGVAASLLAAQGCMLTGAGEELDLGALSESGAAPAPTGNTSSAALTANNDTGFQSENGDAILIPTASLLANDASPNSGSVEIRSVSNAQNGLVELEGAFVKFTPAEGFTGVASFDYEIGDSSGASSVATVQIGVRVDAPPIDSRDLTQGGLNPELPDPRDPVTDPDSDPTQVDEQHSHTDDSMPQEGMPGNDDSMPHDHDPDHPMIEDPHSAHNPHPDDPSKHAEHMAALNLVPVGEASHVAVKNGSWFDPTTWANGVVPDDDATVLIPQGFTVSYDGESDASIFTVRVDGALTFATDRDTFLEVDTMVVTPSGALTIGTSDDPVASGVESVISFADNGPIDVSWDPMLLSRGLISHGSVDIYGAEKENFLKLATDPMAGDTSIVVDGAADGWEVGDKLVLTGTHLVDAVRDDGQPYSHWEKVRDVTEDEELTITRIEGDRIFFDQPLQFDHDTPRDDLKAYVANYTRNVRFETENADNVEVHERGHVMFMHNDDIDVRYVEFHELGRTNKNERSFDHEDLDTIAADSNVKGRYAVHVHRAGVEDLNDPAVLIGNSVWGSPGWGFVHHDSNAIFSDNAAYNVDGAAFVAETGNETGRWSGNIAIKSIGVWTQSKDQTDLEHFDMGRNGVGFWHQGRLVESADNVAAGMPGGTGFVYLQRGPQDSIINVDPSTAPQGDKLRYLDDVNISLPNISLFQNNETIAARHGLEVIKGGPEQGHDVRSVLEDFTAWEVYNGALLEYTAHYTLLDFDLTGASAPLRDTYRSTGIEIRNNAFDMVFNGVNIDGFTTGIDPHKVTVNTISDVTGDDDFAYIYIDVNVSNATEDIANITPGDTFLTRADLVDGRLLYTPDFEGAVAPGSAFDDALLLTGIKVDSIGAVATSNPWDPFKFNSKNLQGALEQNGYWKTEDGRTVTLIEEYVSDRATGEVTKVGVFVEVPDDNLLIVPRFVRTEPEYNGILDEDSAPPVAVDDTARVNAGESVTIDVLSNDFDPDGDSISLGGIWSPNGRVVANDDGTVTFFADPDSEGDFAFCYWAEDDNGNFTMGQGVVTVDI